MKKLIITLLCLAIVCGGGYLGYKQYHKKQQNKISVDVYPVSMMLDSYWGSNYETWGNVVAGSSQKVNLDNAKLVSKVLVSEGDVIEVGTPLLEYDMTVLDLEVDQVKNNVDIAQDDINIAKKELARIRGLKASEDLPKEPEKDEDDNATPVMPNSSSPDETNDTSSTPDDIEPEIVTVSTINKTSTPVSGTGTKKDPYIFNCNTKTVVKKDYFELLKTKFKHAEFVVYDDNDTKLYAWNVNGLLLPKTGFTDCLVAANVTINEDGSITFKISSNMFGSYKTIAPAIEDDTIIDDSTDSFIDDYSDFDFDDSDYDDDYDDDSDDDDSDMASEDYIYSRAELRLMISEKETEIQGLEIEKKAADLAYKKALQEQKDGKVLSTISGVVKTAQDPNDINPDLPFILVQGSGGLTIEGYVKEMKLNDINVGTKINVENWFTGISCEAEITEIVTDSVADTGSYYDGMNNPNSSEYLFRAEVGEDVDFSTGDGISITFPEMSEDSYKCLPLEYLRQEEGRYYVMKADKNNKLTKQYVKTGKIYWGYMIEIKGGLNKDDRICFPYGKDVKEGVKTKDSTELVN